MFTLSLGTVVLALLLAVAITIHAIGDRRRRGLTIAERRAEDEETRREVSTW